MSRKTRSDKRVGKTIEEIEAENVPPECGGTGFIKATPKIDPSEVRDELITVYCSNLCKYPDDPYFCPDHNCLVMRLLIICSDEGNK